jgi:hypothetical protein
MMRLELEEEENPLKRSFLVHPIKNVSLFQRDDVLLCECDRPLILPAAYSPTARDEGTTQCALADRFIRGSLLEIGRLPAMVNVFVLKERSPPSDGEPTDDEALFAYTGVLSRAR